MARVFAKIAVHVSRLAGHYLAFMVAVTVLIIWLLTGPVFGFSDTWQLVINTSTSVITFLMVFLIQNSQNRDMRAIHLKLDELIRSIDQADNDLIDAEENTDEELDRLQLAYAQLAAQHRILKQQLDRIEDDTQTP
jgi:low affinity Fe/Cu permease